MSAMASEQVPVTITYRKPGTNPPVFVSGTFSDPPWQPTEMSCMVDNDSNHVFQLETSVPAGSKVEYKFRLGPGDWWALDETADTVSDDAGNLNNVMTAPTSNNKGNVDHIPDLNEVAGEVADEKADPPMFQSHELADDEADPPMLSHEVADDETDPPMFQSHELTDDEADPPMLSHEFADDEADPPMLSHELADDEADPPMLPHELADDEADPPMLSHESYRPDDIEEWPISLPTTDEEVFGKPRENDEEIDSNDPRFEHFPCENRRSIIAALRKIKGSVSEDGSAVTEEVSASLTHPLSPKISPLTPDSSTSSRSSRRSSNKLDLPGEHAMDLPRSPRSLASLQSIEETMEEPSDTIEGRMSETGPEATSLQDRSPGNNPVSTGSVVTQTITGPVVAPFESRSSASSSDDEGISMKAQAPFEENDVLRRRSSAKTPANSRSKTPSTAHPVHGASNNGNWLQNFLHVVFVDWVGGFFVHFWNRFLRGKQRQT